MEKLLVSVCKWGKRKQKDIDVGGLYLINFGKKTIEREFKMKVLNNSHRSAGGVCFNNNHIFAAYYKGDMNFGGDSILILDYNFNLIKEVKLGNLLDVHQLFIKNNLLWITNTNFNQIIVMDINNYHIVGSYTLKHPEEEILRNDKHIKDTFYWFGDKWKRIHINSIYVNDNDVLIGHFGILSGDFNSSQLTKVEWKSDEKGNVNFGKQFNIDFRGYEYPHNAFMYEGVKKVCNSKKGVFSYNDRDIFLGGWTRGVAESEEYFYVGRSSYTYDDSKTSDNMLPAAILKIDKNNMKIKDEFIFKDSLNNTDFGQLYDVHIFN